LNTQIETFSPGLTLQIFRKAACSKVLLIVWEVRAGFLYWRLMHLYAISARDRMGTNVGHNCFRIELGFLIAEVEWKG
jgi:hypothetical protein